LYEYSFFSHKLGFCFIATAVQTPHKLTCLEQQSQTQKAQIIRKSLGLYLSSVDLSYNMAN